MRIAIVDDIETERALLKMRLERQLSLYGVETEILEFDSSESFLAAEKERHFTVAFLDISPQHLPIMHWRAFRCGHFTTS